MDDDPEEEEPDTLEHAWKRLRANVDAANRVSTTEADVGRFREWYREASAEVLERTRVERAKAVAAETPVDLSDEALGREAKHTDGLPLHAYEGLLHLTPRLVNVVTVRFRPYMLTSLNTANSGSTHLPCSYLVVGRGRANPRIWVQAAARPAADRLAVLQRLLRAAPLRRRAARI